MVTVDRRSVSLTPVAQALASRSLAAANFAGRKPGGLRQAEACTTDGTLGQCPGARSTIGPNFPERAPRVTVHIGEG